MLDALISTAELNDMLGTPELRLLDARLYVPGMGRDGNAEYREAHINGAIRYDLDEFSDRESRYPHMLPSAESQAFILGRLGVASDHDVVIYDTIPGLGAMRLWWQMKGLGHKSVAVLDGGYEKWVAEDRPVDDFPATARPTDYVLPLRPGPEIFVDLSDVQIALSTGNAQVVDVRPADRFSGAIKEPRPECRSGHIPGSRNVPFVEIFQPDGTVAPADVIGRSLTAAGVDPGQPMILSCGSGVSAAAVAFGLHVKMGLSSVRVYDASWSEWGSREDLPLETGPAA